MNIMGIIIIVIVGWLLLRVADSREGKGFWGPQRTPRGMGWIGFIVCVSLLVGLFVAARVMQ